MFKPSDVWRWLFGDGEDDSGHWLGLLVIIFILFLLFGCESCESFLNGRASEEEQSTQQMQEQMQEYTDEMNMQMEEMPEGEVLGEQVERGDTMEGELQIDGEVGSTRVYEYTGGWSETLDGEFLEHSFFTTAFPGDILSFEVRAENVGSATWELADRASINVIGGALANPWAYTANWVTDLRPDEADVAVPPGDVYTFALEVQAPNAPGVYELPLMLSHDVGEPQFVRFDNEQAVVTITVVAQSNGGGSGSAEEEDDEEVQVLGEQVFREDPPQNNGNPPGETQYLGGGGGGSSSGGGGSSSGGGGGSSSGGGGSEGGEEENEGEEETLFLSLTSPESTPHTTTSLAIILGGDATNIVDLLVDGVTSTASSTITSTTWQYPVTLTPDTTNTFQIRGASASGTLTSIITVEIVHTSAVESGDSIVIISEIAWMGTEADYNDEWMEVTNVGSSDVDLTGYQIRWGYNMASDTYSNSLTFPSVTLPSGASTIVERTSQQTVSNVTGTLVYTGALGNSGDRVQLLDASGNVVDDVNSTEDGWFAGDNTTKHTMVRYATAADVSNGAIPSGWAGWCTWGYCLSDNVLEGERSGLDADDNEIQGSPGGTGLRSGEENGGGGGNGEESCEQTESCETEGPSATVHFQKIVCAEESLLPNGEKNVVITSTTAQEFVDASEGDCWFEEGWDFQWKEGKISLSAALDVYGAVEDWYTVGPTNEYGVFTTTIDLTEISHVSVREVLEYGFIPYTYWNEGKKNTDDVTAEFYCSNGAGNNYDNLAWLQNLEDGDERYCVAFNAPVEEPCEDYAYDGSCEEEESTPEATVHFQKVICEDESILPNGKKNYEVTEDTAQEFVDSSEGRCYLAEGWSFQWKEGKISNSASLDVYGELEDWMTVGPTDEYGLYSTIIDLTEIEHVSVREVLQEGYIPYTYVANGNKNTDDVTAEFYCSHGAGNNYDNLAWLQDLEDGDERYCVAFNVPEVFVPEGEITSPEDGSTVSGDITLSAVYEDGDDENDDIVQWAVRSGTCAAGTGTVFGNVDGHSDSYSWDGKYFSAEIPDGTIDNGEYCFVFNPKDDGDVDVRETSEFTVYNEPEEEEPEEECENYASDGSCEEDEEEEPEGPEECLPVDSDECELELELAQ